MRALLAVILAVIVTLLLMALRVPWWGAMTGGLYAVYLYYVTSKEWRK